MNGSPSPLAPGKPGAAIVYPDGDGKPMAETGIHVLVMLTLIATLRHYFRHRPDVYVIGNIFLYYEEGHPESRRSPDVMVVKGVEPGEERRSFKTWEERAVPSVIIEITSEETADEDQGPKRQLYERLGVREYFLFDPLGDYLPQALVGYRLIGEEYEPLPPAQDGGILSAELGMRLVPEGSRLALLEFRTGKRIPTPPEAYRMVRELQERLSQAEQEARQAQEQARQAEQRVSQREQELQQERQRRAELEAELARLRAQLPPGGEGAGPAAP
jgi:Uma2 family endonuclease